MDYKQLKIALNEAVEKKDFERVVSLFTIKNVKVLTEMTVKKTKMKNRLYQIRDMFSGFKNMSDDEMLEIFDEPMSEEEIRLKIEEFKNSKV